MARRPGISKSTFYREWRRSRLTAADYGPMIPPNALRTNHAGVIRREDLKEVLAAERKKEAAAIATATRRAVLPNYTELRALGRSDIRARREAAGISSADMAALAGVSTRVLMQIENGTRKPSADVQSKIDAALLIPPA